MLAMNVDQGAQRAGVRWQPLNQDECEGRMLAVYAEHARITEDVLSSNAGLGPLMNLQLRVIEVTNLEQRLA